MISALNGRADKAAVWRRRIAAQQSSGSSIRRWCRDNDCHEHGFYWWRARLRQQPGRRPVHEQPQDQPAFLPVLVHQEQSGSVEGRIAIELRGGRMLHLPVSMPPTNVAQLVHAIEGTP